MTEKREKREREMTEKREEREKREKRQMNILHLKSHNRLDGPHQRQHSTNAECGINLLAITVVCERREERRGEERRERREERGDVMLVFE